MSALNAFNNQVENFIKDLLNIYPDDSHFKVGYEKFKLIRSMNVRKVHTLFKLYVVPYRKYIVSRDDTFFSNELIKEHSADDDTFQKVFNFKEMWHNGMTDKNKNIVWTYLSVLLILADRA